LRILFLSQEYPPETGWGGIGSYLFTLAPALAARGHQVHVLSCVEGQKASDSLDRGVHLHRRGLLERPRTLRLLHRVLRAPQTVHRIWVALSNYYWYRQLDTVVEVVEYPDWFAEGLLLAWRRPTATVAQLHTPLVVVGKYLGHADNRDFRWACRLERSAVRRADVLSCPSRLLLNELTGSGWLRGRNPRVLPLPVDWATWRDVAPVSQTEPTVAVVGRLDMLKSPETVVRAVNALRPDFPQARAVFAGHANGFRDGLPYDQWLRGLATYPGSCELLGPVPRRELPTVISKARVLAAPSAYDNFPVAVLEAMASGRPVVVSENTGLAPIIRDNQLGAVVPAGDPGALASALQPFLSDAAYAAHVGRRAMNFARTLLDPDVIAREREDLYANALANFALHGASNAAQVGQARSRLAF